VPVATPLELVVPTGWDLPENAQRVAASGAGLRPSLTGIQAYTAAKHALVGLTKQLSQDLGRYGITSNAVAPGFVRSNPSTERQWRSLGPEGQARLVENDANGESGDTGETGGAGNPSATGDDSPGGENV